MAGLAFFPPNIASSSELVDLAVALAWISSKRDKGGGFLRKRPPEKLERLVRLCLELDSLNLGDRGGCVLFDPSALFGLRVRMVNYGSISAAMNMMSAPSPDLRTTVARAKAAADVISSSTRVVEFPGLVPPEAAEVLIAEAWEGGCEGAVPPRSREVDPSSEIGRGRRLAEEFEREVSMIEEVLASLKSTREVWLSRLGEEERRRLRRPGRRGRDSARGEQDWFRERREELESSLGRLQSVLEDEVAARRKVISVFSGELRCVGRVEVPAYAALLRGRRERVLFVPPLRPGQGGLGRSIRKLLGRAVYSLDPRLPGSDLVSRAERALGPGGELWGWFMDETADWEAFPLSPDEEREVSMRLAELTDAGILNDRAASETLSMLLS